MSEQLNRIEERHDQLEQMMTNLIQMQTTNNLHIEEMRTDIEEIQVDSKSTNKNLQAFRKETGRGFRRQERRLDSFEQTMDDTIDRLEQIESPGN